MTNAYKLCLLATILALASCRIGPRWTYDKNFEKPAGIKQVGTWTEAYYTEEQQARLNINEKGESLVESLLANMQEHMPQQPEAMMGTVGPRWTWDHDFEKPAGVETHRGGWTEAVYTKEQQQRLNIDKNGAALPAPIGDLNGKANAIGPRWTWDSKFEKPAGEKDMGGWTQAVYTEEQMQRLGVDQNGVEKAPLPLIGGMAGSIGPRWTWDKDYEKPAGEKDMGGWTESVYTAEQQARMGVDEYGKILKKKEEEMIADMVGPRWTWDKDFEKPAGEKDMGGWTQSVYTEEQQARLGVDSNGKTVRQKHGMNKGWDKHY